MSDDAQEDTTPKAPTTRPPVAPTGTLQKPSDIASRPGFRSPANAKSKAQKAGAKKKR